MIHELMLMETDEIKLKNYITSLLVRKVECDSILHDLRLFSLIKSNEFLRIEVANRNELIFYALDNKIIVPKCMKVKTPQRKSLESISYKPIDGICTAEPVIKLRTLRNETVKDT